MKKALVIRLGAFGDHLLVSPVFTRLKELGYHIVYNTNKRGMDLFKGDDRIDEFLPHKEDMPYDKLREHWDTLKKKIEPEHFINYTSSIENNVALHPTQPLYIYPKKERYEKCNRNYYEVSAEWSGLTGVKLKPILKFTKEEKEDASACIREGWYNVLWCLSGSGCNKVYPWTEYVMGSLIKKYPNIHFITVGDYKCKLLESDTLPKENFTELAGEINIRKSMCLTGLVDLVISPDTGILHASGMYNTPKIGLLGHTTKENITKHFKNDYSIEAECACAPCFYLIYNYDIQCPIENVTRSAWCMSVGIPPEKLFERVCKVKEIHG